MRLTYHLVPTETWASADSVQPFEAESLAAEGFVHCTDGAEELVASGNRHLRDDPRPYVVLTLDLDRTGSPWRYDEPGRPYPHVYGPIDRAAVVAVTPIGRRPDGRFEAFAG